MDDAVAWFAFPWALVALLALPLLPRGRGWPWRLAVLAALVVALAQPQRPAIEDRVAVLVDVSDSVGDAGDGAEATLARTLGVDATVYRFAGDVARVEGAAAAEATTAGIAPGSTDVARALAVALADGARRVVLVSDGIDSTAAGMPSSAAVPVDVVVLPTTANARLEALTAPDRVTPGASIEAVAIVVLDQAARVVLRPDVNGVALDPVELELPAGRHAVPFRVAAPTDDARAASALQIGAALEVDFAQPTGDDAQTTEVAVAARGAVLVIGDPAAAALLRAQGFEVEEATPDRVAAPFDPAAVVLRAGAGDFTPGQLELLARYVDQGGGLLMTGGPQGFGLGGWYRTPLESTLPVRSDVRTEVTVPQVAMVMVLDVSQSMAAGQPSRLELAKRGVIDVVDLAFETDLLGLIVFSDPSSTRWAFELRPATESGKRAMRDATLVVQPQGGTVLGPAYEQALEALAASDAAIKHVIVLSDGKLYDGQGAFAGAAPDWEATAAGARLARITTSAIAIGADADRVALEGIARGGGGRFYEAFDTATLPRLFTNEALTASRDLLRDERVAPEGRRHPLSPFEGFAPTVDAYVATTLAPTGEPLFVALDDEPLLAVGRAGLGRSAALTTDLNAWAGDFGRWSELPGVLGGVVRWLQARPEPYSATARPRGGVLDVVVDAVVAGAYVNDRPLVARFQGTETELRQVAPGRYVGELPVRGSGGTLVVADGADVVARHSVATPDPELAGGDGGAALAALAERSGGDVLAIAELSAYQPAGSATAAPLWGWAAALAFALLLAELAWRRFAPDPADVSRPEAR